MAKTLARAHALDSFRSHTAAYAGLTSPGDAIPQLARIIAADARHALWVLVALAVTAILATLGLWRFRSAGVEA